MSQGMERRVVITGMGAITPIGAGKEGFWEGLKSGRSGVQRVDDLFDLTGVEAKIGAPIRNFDPLNYMDKKRARRLGRSTQFAMAAARQALEDSLLNLERED